MIEQRELKSKSGAMTGAVMVCGGGIAGMQAALDLANSGFKVYLVEKSPTIGGKMAQLDKTFPTGDCDMHRFAKARRVHTQPEYRDTHAVAGRRNDRRAGRLPREAPAKGALCRYHHVQLVRRL
jgi:heterodisulfide reductase subunit A